MCRAAGLCARVLGCWGVGGGGALDGLKAARDTLRDCLCTGNRADRPRRLRRWGSVASGVLFLDQRCHNAPVPPKPGADMARLAGTGKLCPS